MNLKVKTLDKEYFFVNVQPNQTISQIKQKIHAQKRISVQLQKIFVNGKVAQNADTVQSLKLFEYNFVVLMIIPKKNLEKKKNQSPEKGQEAIHESNSEPIMEQEFLGNKKQEEGQKNVQLELKIKEMMKMGFDKQICESALQKTGFDLIKASDLLVEDISIEKPQKEIVYSQSEQNLMRKLMQKESFRQLRMIMRDKSCIKLILEQLKRTQPILYNLIEKYPQTFQKIMMQDLPDEFQQPTSKTKLTSENKQFIKRMISYGYKKNDAIKTFLKCKKDEDMTFNLLLKSRDHNDMKNQEGFETQEKKERKESEENPQNSKGKENER